MVKNLRICGDCHRSTKLIAAIRQCEIIVRDANRIHHFYKNGQCSFLYRSKLEKEQWFLFVYSKNQYILGS
ncbi:unnamed protein product, partial [Rotaria magnacalcarata]